MYSSHLVFLQVRTIAEVTTAVALGNLSKKITLDVRGEILELKNTINTMVDQLNSFASEVTRVAREVTKPSLYFCALYFITIYLSLQFDRSELMVSSEDRLS